MNHLYKNMNDLLLSTDPALQQLDAVHGFLKRTYWAANRKRETVEKSIQTSLCFGVYRNKEQVAFARIVTDYCTFAYLCDVFVKEEYRGQGISKWMMETIVAHPELKSLRRFLLATTTAQSLYARYGFQPLAQDEQQRFMGIRNDDV